MWEKIDWPAPAKINLFLRITRQREDGYHELQTAFQFVDLCDVLRFQPRDDDLITRSLGPSHVPAQDDLAVQAAHLLKQTVATACSGADIQIKKNIPMGGGLGGASSDAATTLHALNYYWRLDLDVDALSELGARLGADVPVFVRGQAAWAEGIGEKLTAISPAESYYLIVDPQVHVATAEMYAASELTRNCPTIKICSPQPGAFGNVFEKVVRKRYAQVDEAFVWLEGLTAVDKPFLTGSGACIVAPFVDQASAKECQKDCPAAYRAYVVKGYNCSPLAKLVEALNEKN